MAGIYNLVLDSLMNTPTRTDCRFNSESTCLYDSETSFSCRFMPPQRENVVDIILVSQSHGSPD